MKKTTLSVLATALISSSAFAQNADLGKKKCEIVEIIPEDADFFSGGFRTVPVVGDTFDINFESFAITEIILDRGAPFFSKGEARLSKIERHGLHEGFGGLRFGLNGLYIGLVTAPVATEDDPQIVTSSLEVTQTNRDWETGELTVSATHTAKLVCQ